METLMQKHIKDMREVQKIVKAANSDKYVKEAILETIEGCIENAVHHDKQNQPDWQSVAEKLAEALDEFRTVSTLPNTEVFEKADKKCQSALNEYKKLKE